jgi:hypothetical protein
MQNSRVLPGGVCCLDQCKVDKRDRPVHIDTKI